MPTLSFSARSTGIVWDREVCARWHSEDESHSQMAELGVREQSLQSHRIFRGEEEEQEEGKKVLLHPQGNNSTLDVRGSRVLE